MISDQGGQIKPRPIALEEKLGRDGSAFSKYQRTVVGHNGLAALFLYELINFFILPLPGRTGRWLRQRVSPCIFGRSGDSISMGSNCTIRNGAGIFIGNAAVIEKDVTLDVKPGENRLSNKLNNTLRVGDGVHIGRRSIFNCNGGNIEIGDNTEIGSFCRLGSLRGLKIGGHCTIGDRCCLAGASHSFARLDAPILQQPLSCKGAITIGDHVTIGEGVTILDGVTIGDGVTILSGSLVNKNIAEDLMVTGVPARPVD
jgi:galactoside O-acetyltransferase